MFSNQQAGNVKARPISRLSTVDFHSLAFSPTEPDTVYFGHHQGLLISRNGGKDWEPTGLQNADAMGLAIASVNPQIMYAGGHNIFVKSTDSGKSWQSVTTNLPGLDIHGLAVEPENANRLYAHIVGFGIFGSRDGGATWTTFSTTAPPSIMSLAVGENSQSLYAASMQAGLLHTADGGQTWTRITGIPGEGVMAVTYVAGNKRIFVTTIGNAAGLYVSDDSGKTWLPTGLTGSILAVAASPLDVRHIIAIDDQGQVFVSHDNGISWPGE
jgi:photosystem II stability/assembly factor-like uncharacterized protein